MAWFGSSSSAEPNG